MVYSRSREHTDLQQEVSTLDLIGLLLEALDEHACGGPGAELRVNGSDASLRSS